MADPRDAVSYEGIGYEALTYAHDDTIVYSATQAYGSAQVGLAVTLESNKTVSLVGDGEQVEGILVKVEDDGYCVVQTGGIMEMPGGEGATLTAGKAIVGDLGASSAEGYVREVATGTAAELGRARGTIIDSSTPSATIVRFPSAN